MIEGLRLTFPGEEVRRLLKERAQAHLDRADYWKRERMRTKEEFIRERIEPGEVYRLTDADLAFGELLPEKPGWMEQQEYEERTAVGFQLERIAKEIGRMPRVLA